MNGKITNQMQIASLRRYTLTEGRAQGLDVIDCDNGKLRFLINVSKACDIMQMYHEGENLSFISKNGFEKRELAFARRFEGGMLYTCGLDSLGARTGYEIHGTLHNIPAEIVHAEVTEDEIVVEALIKDTNHMKRNLQIRRKISSRIGSTSVKVEDILENRGFEAMEYALLYHVNLGYPMLDEGARVKAEVTSFTTRTEHAAAEAATRFEMGAPIVGAEESCFYYKMAKPEISLENEKNGKRFTLAYSGDTLPAFVHWKNVASGLYVMGFEPSTTELGDGFVYKTIESGERISFMIEMTVSSLK